jgi:hypothetical protein
MKYDTNEEIIKRFDRKYHIFSTTCVRSKTCLQYNFMLLIIKTNTPIHTQCLTINIFFNTINFILMLYQKLFALNSYKNK